MDWRTTVENRFLRGEYEKTKKELGNRRHASDGTVLRVQDQEDIGLHCTSSPHALTQILQKGYVPRDIPCRHQMPSERITAVLERAGYIWRNTSTIEYRIIKCLFYHRGHTMIEVFVALAIYIAESESIC